MFVDVRGFPHGVLIIFTRAEPGNEGLKNHAHHDDLAGPESLSFVGGVSTRGARVITGGRPSGASSGRRREGSRVRTRPSPAATTSARHLLREAIIARWRTRTATPSTARRSVRRRSTSREVRRLANPPAVVGLNERCDVRPTTDRALITKYDSFGETDNASIGPRAVADIARARCAAGALGACGA